MALRAGLVLVLLSLAFVAESFDFASSDTISSFDFDAIQAKSLSVANGRVGDAIDVDEEMMLDSESARRGLQQQGKYVSYRALKANRVPCNKRGRSYYNCNQRGRANPYKRGCSAITKCARYT